MRSGESSPPTSRCFLRHQRCRTTAILAAAVTLLLGSHAEAWAQHHLPSPRWEDPWKWQSLGQIVPPPEAAASDGEALGGALLGAVVGAAAGFALYSSKEGGEIQSAVQAAIAGSSLGIPLGLFLADGLEGDPGAPALASIALGGIGILLGPPVVLIPVIPVAQIAVALHFRDRPGR